MLFGPSRLIPVQSIVFAFQVQHSGAMCLPDVTLIESLQLGRSGILNSSLIGHGVVKLLQSTWYHHMMKNHIPWLFCHIYWQSNIKGEVWHQEEACSHLHWGCPRSQHQRSGVEFPEIHIIKNKKLLEIMSI